MLQYIQNYLSMTESIAVILGVIFLVIQIRCQKLPVYIPTSPPQAQILLNNSQHKSHIK